MARKAAAKIRVLRAETAEFVELGTFEMLGQVVTIGNDTHQSVTDSL